MLTTKDLQLIKGLIDESRKQFTEDVANFKAEILAEIKNLREEVIVVVGYKQQIEDLDERVTKLEQHPSKN